MVATSIEIGDNVKIVGGSAHVGKTGILKNKTKVMATVELTDTGISVKKKKKFLKKVTVTDNVIPKAPKPTTPTAAAATTNDPKEPEDEGRNNAENIPLRRQETRTVTTTKAGGGGPRTLAELAAAQQQKQKNAPTITNDILITVPSIITTDNMNTLLDAAAETIEAICGKDSLYGRGIVLRNMKEFKFKLKEPALATRLVDHFNNLNNDNGSGGMILMGQVCSVSLAEPGMLAPPPPPLAENNLPYDRRKRSNYIATAAIEENKEALPPGRSLFDRLQDGGGPSKRRRRW